MLPLAELCGQRVSSRASGSSSSPSSFGMFDPRGRDGAAEREAFQQVCELGVGHFLKRRRHPYPLKSCRAAGVRL